MLNAARFIAMVGVLIGVASSSTAAQTVLAEIQGSIGSQNLGSAVSGLGDVDSDGFRDYAVGSPFGFATCLGGRVTIHSGKDHSILRTHFGPTPCDRFGAAVAAAGDVSGDGIPDFLIGAPGADLPTADAGRVILHSGAPVVVAAVSSVGAGCGAGGLAPQLTASRPVLARPWQLQLTSATPGVSGALLASAPPAANLLLGPGCIASVNPFFMTQVAPVTTTAAGTWTLSANLSSSPLLAGVGVVLQAVVGPTGGPLGIDLSNGLEATLGW